MRRAPGPPGSWPLAHCQAPTRTRTVGPRGCWAPLVAILADSDLPRPVGDRRKFARSAQIWGSFSYEHKPDVNMPEHDAHSMQPRTRKSDVPPTHGAPSSKQFRAKFEIEPRPTTTQSAPTHTACIILRCRLRANVLRGGDLVCSRLGIRHDAIGGGLRVLYAL
jgi:hypothetical protein